MYIGKELREIPIQKLVKDVLDILGKEFLGYVEVKAHGEWLNAMVDRLDFWCKATDIYLDCCEGSLIRFVKYRASVELYNNGHYEQLDKNGHINRELTDEDIRRYGILSYIHTRSETDIVENTRPEDLRDMYMDILNCSNENIMDVIRRMDDRWYGPCLIFHIAAVTIQDILSRVKVLDPMCNNKQDIYIIRDKCKSLVDLDIHKVMKANDIMHLNRILLS